MGAAVHDAGRKVVAQLAALAGWPALDSCAGKGQLHHGGQSRPVCELMREAGIQELTGDGEFALPGNAQVDDGDAAVSTRTFGVMFVEVGVDPQLGLLRLRRATGVYSAGRIINPRTARSQMIGGLVQP